MPTKRQVDLTWGCQSRSQQQVGHSRLCYCVYLKALDPTAQRSVCLSPWGECFFGTLLLQAWLETTPCLMCFY